MASWNMEAATFYSVRIWCTLRVCCSAALVLYDVRSCEVSAHGTAHGHPIINLVGVHQRRKKLVSVATLVVKKVSSD